ncbi:MAG TPA: tetratricopeptide repeat protein [Isosphaeraceae bacterium]
MVRITRDRTQRLLDAAAGYLELDLPEKALEILQGRPDWATMPFESSLLTGQALRALGRYREALRPLEAAAALRPQAFDVAIELAWCYKRTHRLAQAIDVLDRARRVHPTEPLLRYNLACYWSLAQDPARALAELAVALTLEPRVLRLVADEPDFDPLRAHPEFQRLTAGHAPSV